MRKLKRVGWFCFAGCCCAALILVGSERSQQTKLNASDGKAFGSASYCPNALFGQFEGVYFYSAYLQGADCLLPTLYGIGSNRVHETGPCGTCPDPIVVLQGQTAPVELANPSLVPQPDPLFSGVLR